MPCTNSHDFQESPQMVKPISRKGFGVRVGAGLTAQSGGARGQAPAYYDSIRWGCLVFKNHRESLALFHVQYTPYSLQPASNTL